MITTEVELTVQAGSGGDGRVSFTTFPYRDPDGGDGGDGGDVYIVGTTDLDALNVYAATPFQKAADGEVGQAKTRKGFKGKDLILKFPIGTTLTDKKSGMVFTLTDTKERIKIARGGRGGRGNYSLKFVKNLTRHYIEKGLSGTLREYFVDLKLLAHFGLIGYPNTGKSSLLNELTSSRVKVADYPFTTIEPNIGSFNGKIIADIPGLIEGASEGKGLGTKFLKHIERVEMLIHCVAADSSDVVADYEHICQEIQAFSPELLKKKKLILLTRSDLVDEANIKQKETLLKTFGHPVLRVSIHNWEQMELLRTFLKDN